VQIVWIIATFCAACLLVALGWRWASRNWQLPCPSLFGWALESRFYQRLSGTATTLDRLGLQPGQRILEIGPGPGRLLIPAAMQLQPGGEAVGIDIQPGMIDRLKRRSTDAGIANLTAILGDATKPHVDEASFDLVFLATTLGEIPDRSAVLAESYKALKPGGILSITEIFGDPHYQSQATVKRLAAEVGFQLKSIQGRSWFFTAKFVKPDSSR
jgi:ubiquinone/menaquinone biosynthesis C-methylase UbiE